MTRLRERFGEMWRVEKARWPFPVAIVFHGSVMQCAVWGLTRENAWRRGWEWIAAQDAKSKLT